MSIKIVFYCETPELARALIDHYERVKVPGQHIDNPAPSGADKIASYTGPWTNPPANVPVTSAPELDSFGIPWHEDHHSTNKARNADGSWRSRRGGDKDAATRYAAQFMPDTPAPVYSPDPVQEMPWVFTATATPAPAPVTQVDFMKLVIELAQAGRLTNAGFAQLGAPHGIAQPAELAPDDKDAARLQIYTQLKAL